MQIIEINGAGTATGRTWNTLPAKVTDTINRLKAQLPTGSSTTYKVK
jgi:hypothetical protein